MSEFEKLQDLYNMGFICEEEFIQRKEALGIFSNDSDSSTPNLTTPEQTFDIRVPEEDPV